ncbi:MAG TPA: sugar ABC transporter substrate-binding protein [Clostridiaceae bacterium]|nr:sugar ABC transporter substrate-binding protein [Clostridiaceae bacterium]
MSKKSLISLVLVVLMVVGILSGCGGAKKEEPDTAKTEPATTAEEQKPAETTDKEETTTTEEKKPWEGKRLGIAHITLYDEWCTEVKRQFELQGAEMGFGEINVQDGNLNAETQQKQVEDFISKKYDAIIVDPVSSEGIIPTLEAATAAGIPVFAFDSYTPYEDLVAWVAWDHAKTGEIAARWVANYAREKLGGKVKVGLLAMLNADHTRVRGERFLEVLKEELGEENIEIVFNQDFGETRESAANIVNNNIMKPIDVIWCAVDNGAMGAVSALETNGIKGTIVVSSGCNGAEPLRMIADPEAYYRMGVGAPDSPEQVVRLVLQAVADYFSGKEVEPVQYVEFFPIDSTNIDQYREYFE